MQYDLGMNITKQAPQSLVSHLAMHRDFLCLQLLMSDFAAEGHLPLWHGLHSEQLREHSRVLVIEAVESVTLTGGMAVCSRVLDRGACISGEQCSPDGKMFHCLVGLSQPGIRISLCFVAPHDGRFG